MTRHGCPESSVHGSQEGYLDITWQRPQYPHVRISGDGNPIEKVINVSKEHFFETSDKHMLVSSSQYEFKFSFCYKVIRNISVDIGSWPNRDFSIYGTENGCPEGNLFISSEGKLYFMSKRLTLKILYALLKDATALK
jgi:hypothetical protein